MNKYVPCPRCGGHPDVEPETGIPYTCYFCFDQGVVDAAVVEAEERAQRDYDEQFRPRMLGTYVQTLSPDDYDGMSDAELDELHRPGRRLFTRLIWIAPEPRHVVHTADEFDDIPF